MMFRNYLKEEMEKDSEFKQFWEARNELICGHPVESISLAEMDLSESERIRVLELIQNPEIEKQIDALLKRIISA